MNAIILAAGYATRLRPLSYIRPKVLLPICGHPLLDILLRSLSGSGFNHVHINTHHLSGQISSFLCQHDYALEVKTYHEEEILGTGGGIYRMIEEIPGTKTSVFIINGDILAGIDPLVVWQVHLKSRAAVTMVMIDLPEYNNVLVDRDFSIVGFGEKAKPLADKNPELRFLAFTGMHVVNKDIVLRYSPNKKFFSIIETYENAISAGEKVKAMFVPHITWQEVGSVEGYVEAHKRLMRNSEEFAPWLTNVSFPSIHSTAAIHRSAKLEESVCIGRNSKVDANTILKNVIIWDNVLVGKDIQLEDTIVCDNCTVQESMKNEILLPEM
ncbi:MAG: hypothetical protein DRG59_04145 [Deltaproteobacteria bacterium]|nr:MAG: hypothetical protein DRG59_04145 [Deltaproteobacteria bacterium]